MKDYVFTFQATLEDHDMVLRDIVRKRKEDVEDSNNLNDRFVRGRIVKRIPSSSTDVVPDDNELDISVGDGVSAPDYLYILVNNSGTLEWRRTGLGVF